MGIVEVRLAPMGHHEANQKTHRIRLNMEENYRLIKEIKDREGWRAMGCDSFEDWAAEFLGQTPMHINRLLTAAQIEEHLENRPKPADSAGAPRAIPEWVLRPLTGLLRQGRGEHSEECPDAHDKINEAWDLAMEASDGAPMEKHVRAAVGQVRSSGLDPGYLQYSRIFDQLNQFCGDMQLLGGIGRLARDLRPETRERYLS
jgi:hypothetical protein